MFLKSKSKGTIYMLFSYEGCRRKYKKNLKLDKKNLKLDKILFFLLSQVGPFDYWLSNFTILSIIRRNEKNNY